MARYVSGPVPIRADPGYLKISKAIDQLALKGKITIGEMPLLGRRRLMLMMLAVIMIPEMKNKKILLSGLSV